MYWERKSEVLENINTVGLIELFAFPNAKLTFLVLLRDKVHYLQYSAALQETVIEKLECHLFILTIESLPFTYPTPWWVSSTCHVVVRSFFKRMVYTYM